MQERWASGTREARPGLRSWAPPPGPFRCAAPRLDAGARALARRGGPAKLAARRPRAVFGFRQRSLHAWPRRLQTWWFNRFSNYAPRTQRVYRVTLNGRHYKRVVLPDSYQAQRVAASLAEFAADRIYPRVIFARERELWVEYVEGRAIRSVDVHLVGQMARLLARINQRKARRVPTAETPFLGALQIDLCFLRDVGVLDAGVYRALEERTQQIAPAALWVGYDCTDAILKNFVLDRDGRLVGVDVESLGVDQLIGSGAAKACTRWLGAHRDSFLARMRAAGAPDFQAYLPFVELCFLAFWTKASLLEGKHRYVDAALFERFSRD